MVAVIDSVE